MKLDEMKQLVLAVEPGLQDNVYSVVHTFERDGRWLNLAITSRLRVEAGKGRVWLNKGFLITLRNASYGFDESRARSRGGSDGLYLMDRGFSPRNEMMRKIFDRFVDREDSGVKLIAQKLGVGVDQLQAVRLVSHHMRLLGVMWRGEDEDWVILVDYDQSKA